MLVLSGIPPPQLLLNSLKAVGVIIGPPSPSEYRFLIFMTGTILLLAAKNLKAFYLFFTPPPFFLFVD